MGSNKGIFIFTRNKPTTLVQTTNRIKSWSGNIFIVDDSTNLEHQQATKQISKINNATYLGGLEFDSFLAKYDLRGNRTDFLLRRPGHPEWNLGYCRNFALLYAFSLNFHKVLFLDDDIIVPNLDIIDLLMMKLGEYLFTGAHIAGLIDDSILGHLATNVGVSNQRMLSGGFLAFNPALVDEYFMNHYNEDWIWLFLQLKGRDYLQKYEVFQELADPFMNYRHRIEFQENGEMLLDGILDLNPQPDQLTLMKLSFWERITQERIVYLKKLKELAGENQQRNYINILDKVLSYHSGISPKVFQDSFISYFSNKETFYSIQKSLLFNNLPAT